MFYKAISVLLSVCMLGTSTLPMTGGFPQGSVPEIVVEESVSGNDMTEESVSGNEGSKDTVSGNETEGTVPQNTAQEEENIKVSVDASTFFANASVTIINNPSEYKLLHYFFREAGTEDYRGSYIYAELGDNELVFNGLKAETTYEYVIGLSNSSMAGESYVLERVTGTFTTQKDNRELKAELMPGERDVTVRVFLSGDAADGAQTHVYCYYREKGDAFEWECRSFVMSETGMEEIEIKSLKGNTTYEYAIGIGGTDSESKDDLFSVTEGEFTTKAREGSVHNVDVVPSYESATFYINFSFNNEKMYRDTTVSYRKKGTEEWKEEIFNPYNGEQLKTDTFTITGLEENTEYEYTISFYDEYIMTPAKLDGVFQTKSKQVEFSVEQDVTKLDTDSAVLILTANPVEKEPYLNVVLYTEYGNIIADVNLLQNAGYTKSILLTGLDSGVTYHINKAVVSAYDSGALVPLLEETYTEKTYVTSNGVNPESMELSTETVVLNAAADKGNNNIAYVTVNYFPQEALQDISYSRPDLSVVSLSIEDTNFLKLTAYEAGETSIKLTSKWNKDIEKTLTVKAEKFVPGIDNGSKTPDQITDTLEIVKGQSLSEIGYYDCAIDENISKLSNVNVTVANEDILSVSESNDTFTFTGNRVGSTYVEFEKDGVKNCIEVKVLHEKYHLSITGLVGSIPQIPAIDNGDGSFTVAQNAGNSYQIQGEFSPAKEFDVNNFVWGSRDLAVACVNDNNEVVPMAKSGRTTIYGYPKQGNYTQDIIEFDIIVKELPPTGVGDVTFFTDPSKKQTLKDVTSKYIPDGWEWKYPDTPVYFDGTGRLSEYYPIVYTNDGYYPYEKDVRVILVNLNDIMVEEFDGAHNNILQVSTPDGSVKDSMKLRLSYNGEPDDLDSGEVIMDIESNKSGITIERIEQEEENFFPAPEFEITAQKKGTYTLTLTAYEVAYGETAVVEKGRKIFSEKLTVKAETDLQVTGFQISNSSDGRLVSVSGGLQGTYEDFEKNPTFTISAQALDHDGNHLDTPLQWKSSDKSIATVKYDAKNSKTAEVTIKGPGTFALEVKAKDKGKYTKKILIHVINQAPRIVNTKASVNLAYDYSSVYAKYLVADTGCIRLVQNDDNPISKIRLKTKDGKMESRFVLTKDTTRNGSYYLVEPTNYSVKTGTYKCKLFVACENEKTYEFPITISVVNKKPKATVKTEDKVNLFYKNDTGTVVITMDSLYQFYDVTWEDKAKTAAGFTISDTTKAGSSYPGNSRKIEIYQTDVKTKGNKPVDTNIAKGTLRILVRGLREPVEVKNVKIGYEYKKPDLLMDGTKQKTKYLVPSMGNKQTEISLYVKSLGTDLVKGDKSSTNKNVYYSITGDNKAVSTVAVSHKIEITYNGKKAKDTVNYTMQSNAWREPLTFKLTLQEVKPKAKIKDSTLTYNKAIQTKISTSVYLDKTDYQPDWMGVECVGKDAKAQALITAGILEIGKSDASDKEVSVVLNPGVDRFSDSIMKAGTYKYSLTPYYLDKMTGQKVKLNTLPLTVKVVDKEVKATASVKGKLDILCAFRTDDFSALAKINTKFTNMDKNYQIVDAKVVGGNSEWFELVRDRKGGSKTDNPYYLGISSTGKWQVKSGATYKLQIEYTIKASNDSNESGAETFVVRSNVINVKPIKGKANIKLEKVNDIIYCDGEINYAEFKMKGSNPKKYILDNVTGRLDIDKNGTTDIYVVDSNGSILVYANDSISPANLKGKSYKVPVRFYFEGSDVNSELSQDQLLYVTVKFKG